MGWGIVYIEWKRTHTVVPLNTHDAPGGGVSSQCFGCALGGFIFTSDVSQEGSLT